MKNIRYLFVVFFVTLLSVSCNSDDDESGSEVNDRALVGTWEGSEVNEGFEVTLTVTFNANQSGILVATTTFEGETETETDPFTWSTNGNKLILIVNGETTTSTYSISGNKLTVTDEDGEVSVLTKV